MSLPAPASMPALTVSAAALTRLGVAASTAAHWSPFMTSILPGYGISTRLRLAAFLGNGLNETGRLQALSESLDYSVNHLLERNVFSAPRISDADCRRLGRIGDYPHVTRTADQQGIANLVYGGAFGLKQLGNTKLTDGWDMRGGGFFQTTGRSNFTRVGARQSMTAEQACAYVRTEEGALRSAAQFFTTSACQAYADAGNITACRHVVSGGSDVGLDVVQGLYRQALQVL